MVDSLQSLERLIPKAGDAFDAYELIEEIGRGGSGAVYRARQTRLDQQVAIKVLLPPLLPADMLLELSKRFDREVKILRELQHPHIVRVSDAGHTPAGFPYYTMELIDGRSLADEIAEGPIDAQRVVRIGRQVVQALAAAHAREVIHRDLKPGNIMLRHDYGFPDYVTVLDFGIAKLLQTEATALTTSLSGTPWYMAPEQALMAAEVDGRVDVYALGVILAECVSGERVVKTDEPMKAALRHALPEPLAFPKAVTRSPLRWVIEKATAKKPDDRFESAEAMGQALEELETGAAGSGKKRRKKRDRGGSSGAEQHDAETARYDSSPRMSSHLSPLASPWPDEAADGQAVASNRGWRRRLLRHVTAPLLVAAAIGVAAGLGFGLLVSEGNGEGPAGAVPVSDADSDEPALLGVSTDELAAREPSPAAVCQAGDPSTFADCLDAVDRVLARRSARGEPDEAIAGLEALCDAGFQGACARLAEALHYAQRVPPDPTRAAWLYDTACESGWPAACVGWVRLVETGRSGRPPADEDMRERLDQACQSGELSACAEQALRRLKAGERSALDAAREACERGSGDGCFAIGEAFARGWAVEADAVRAAWYLREACEMGTLEGCTTLAAQLELEAEGQEASSEGPAPLGPDPDRSLRRLREACDGFEPVACYRLAEGADPSDQIALLTQSCDGGHAPACHRLAERYAEGLGVDVDPSLATHLASWACLGGVAEPCIEAGQRYASGTHVDVNLELASRLYEEACEAGELAGCRLFAALLDEGSGVAEDAERAYELFDRACDGDDYIACYRLGLLMVAGRGTTRERPSSALRRFRRACDEGDVITACHQAGLMVAEEGERRDGDEARGWLARSCDAEEALGCYRLGTLLADGVGGDADTARAAERFERACEHDDMDGCVALGRAYAGGHGRPADAAHAYTYLARACGAGHPVGCLLEGQALRDGRGVVADPSAAVERFDRACTAALPEACYELGLAYLDGSGVAVDPQRARAHLEVGCASDEALGCEALGVLFRDGSGGAADPERAVELFERACDADRPAGCTNLGAAYERGEGVEIDGRDAARLYERACEREHLPGCTGLARLRYGGILVEQDLEQAIDLYRRSCDGGHQPACSELGHALLTGVGVERNTPRAMALIRQACEGGVGDACESLEALGDR